MTHRERRDREEVRAILKLRARLVDKLEVGLVHQCRRLQRAAAPARDELPMGDCS